MGSPMGSVEMKMEFDKEKYEYALMLDEIVKVMAKEKEMSLHIEGPKLGWVIDGGYILEVTEYDSSYFKHAVDGDIPLYATEDDAQLAFCLLMLQANPTHCVKCWENMQQDGVKFCLYKDNLSKFPEVVEVGWEEKSEVEQEAKK